MAFLFWLSVFGAIYSYLFYPLILVLIRLFRNHSTQSQPPNNVNVSLIITAYNEQDRIEEKLQNSLGLDSTGLNLQITVASDDSNDDTHRIVESYANRGVKLVVCHGRLGKESTQKLAIDKSTSDILVFSDVATVLAPDAIINIVSNFADEDIGAVSSVDKFVTENGEVVGEGLYVRYEMWLRSLECDVCTLVGLSGSFFAARKTICAHWDARVPSDFGVAINCATTGMRSISDPLSVGIYKNISDPTKGISAKIENNIARHDRSDAQVRGIKSGTLWPVLFRNPES